MSVKFLPLLLSSIAPASLVFLMSFAAAPARAQSAGTITDVSESKNVTYLDVGAAILSRPIYLGSDDRSENIIPYFETEYKGRFFIKPALGAGVHIINNDRVRLSGGIAYAYGRQAEESESLAARGVDDIDDAFTANGGFRIITPVGVIDSLVTVPFTGNQQGLTASISAITQVAPTAYWKINPGARLSLRSGENSAQFYGVPGSTFAGGFDGGSTYSASAFAVSYFTLGETASSRGWDIVGLVEYSQLLGNVRDSLFVERGDGFTATLGLAKKF